MRLFASFLWKKASTPSKDRGVAQWRIYHWASATWAMRPPFELRKNLAYGKKCNLGEVAPIILHVSILYPHFLLAFWEILRANVQENH